MLPHVQAFFDACRDSRAGTHRRRARGRVMPVRADHRDLQASAECRSRLIAALLMTMAAILERKEMIDEHRSR